ncbi:MAG: sulfotransferase [Crocinitomicaceae bacterium]|nr:sulfotransferase [Crocinitomicaceae bacterium]
MNLKPKVSNYLNIFVHPILGVSIHNWFRVLWKHNFRIHPAFIPKIIFITATAIFNAPFQLLEYLIYSRRIKKQVVKSPVFILGHPRSGTTHLFYLLSKDERFSYCTAYNAVLPHVFLVGGKGLKKMVGTSIPETRPQDNVKMSIDSPKEEEFAMANMTSTSYMFGFYFPRRAKKSFEESVSFEGGESYRQEWLRNYKYYLQKLTYRYPNKQLLIKSPANTGRIKEILELFPDAKFIHIHRDPMEVFQSTKGLYEKIIQTTSFQSANESEVRDYIMFSYRKMYEKFFAEVDLIKKDKLVEIGYNDLDELPLKTIERIYDGLGLEDFSAAKKNIAKELEDTVDYKKNTHSSLTEEEKERINKEWAEIISQLGYS